MDNKITKSRFYNLMAYEWVVVLAILLAGIFVFEFLYAIFGVKLTTGQSFKYFYDINVDNSLERGLMDVLFVENENTFSYDVVLIQGEIVNEEANILATRMRIQEGDVIITDVRKQEENGSVRARTLIDSAPNVPIYNFGQLLFDGREYLKTFLKDEFLILTPEEQTEKVKNATNLSTDKIDEAFLLRMKDDNRFRTEKQKEEGMGYERERIFRLVDELNDFAYLLEVGDELGLLYRYTRYTQKRELATDDKNKEIYDGWIEAEKKEGRENAVYALKVENLTGGQHSPSEFFKVAGHAEAKDVVIMVFDFLSYQPELQFETVGFINSIVRSCSDLYKKDIN